ncbi:protein IWS1 homolog, partial [Ceratina calcarata]|uniref:Protein IWS1 homolog n=1 Tax=Ceratina calcarata TaxID=156304 RepID=A0AAJ7IRX0_9HYME
FDTQERACPLGTGQRRPSRSPRSQRSRSADVDCLKKYTERRVEERRHTEIPDTSKLDPTRWIPLPKNITRVQPASKKSPQTSKDEEKRRSLSDEPEEKTSTPKKLPATKEEDGAKDQDGKNETPSPATYRQAAGRSHSADVGRAKKEKLTEERRNTECSDSRAIATRWLPQIDTSKFRYDASSSPFARSCEITKSAASRWMTFVKNSSSRIDLERKPSATETSPSHGSPLRQAKKESPRWEPIRKFAPRASAESSPKRDELEPNKETPTRRSPDAEQSKRLTQKMRDLYDFKTENEWPKRAVNARRGNAWISKSGSEEDRDHRPARRNSQDLEFNDRAKLIKLMDTKVKSNQEKRVPKEEHYTTGTDTFNNEYEERLRKFNDRLRYSEDLGRTKPKLKERRTYSDDYDQKRRASTRSARAESSLKQEASVRSTRSARSESLKSQDTSRSPVEKKRMPEVDIKSKAVHGEASVTKDSRSKIVTIAKRDSSSSDAPVKGTGKRASMDVKGTGKMVQVPPRRAFSQTEERPSTPVPPVEWNDDRYAAARLKEIAEKREERDSTRYKVYLT